VSESLRRVQEAAEIFHLVEDPVWDCFMRATIAILWPGPDYQRAQSLATEALALARVTGEQLNRVAAEMAAGCVSLMPGGEPAAAGPHFEAGLRLARALGADWHTQLLLHRLADVHRRAGAIEEARQLLQEAVTLSDLVSDRWTGILLRIDLALLSSGLDDRVQAATDWRDALLLARDMGSRTHTPLCLAGAASVLIAAGHTAPAVRLLSAAHAAWQDGELSDLFYGRPFREAYEPTLTTARAELAADAFAEAWATGQRLSLDGATELALDALLVDVG
jgi:hypothetical protein